MGGGGCSSSGSRCGQVGAALGLRRGGREQAVRSLSLSELNAMVWIRVPEASRRAPARAAVDAC